MLTRRIVATAVVFAACVFSASGASAEKSTAQEMEQVCRNWLTYVVREKGQWAGDRDPEIAGTQDLYHEDTMLARVYSIRPRGYVVIPVLKELPPVKAYSETSEFDVTDEGGFVALVREVLSHRINLFIDAYGSLETVQPVKGRVVFEDVNRKGWDRFLMNRERFGAVLGSGTLAPMAQVGPILTTSWHQESPYNNKCPTGYLGGRCLVGCVATATSQVLKYHDWPPTGKGEYSYYWDGDQSCGWSAGGGDLEVDLSDAYDWANMPDDCSGGCSTAQENALAELCYEVGVAFDMDYGVCGSSAHTDWAVRVLRTYFRYDDSIQKRSRRSYTQNEWFGFVKKEIDGGRPIIYRIIGHAIVCDGWRDDGGLNQYHMNYGWDDSHTAWYTLDNLHNSADHLEEYMVRYIIPERDMPDTVYVDPANTEGPWSGTPEYPCGTITYGLQKAADRGAPYVFVVAGTYNTSIEIPEGITLIGEGADSTIISGRDTDDAVTMGENTAISGFTIKQGKENCIVADTAMFVTVTDCVIDDPTANGIYFSTRDGKTGPRTIERCIFRHVPGQAIHANLRAGQSVMIRDCVIEQTGYCGVYLSGLLADQGTGTVQDCVIWGTDPGSGHGVIAFFGDYDIVNNTIHGYNKGLYTANATVDVVNTLLTGCGKGIYAYQSTLDEHHNGFWNNTTDIDGDHTGGEGTMYYDPFYMDAGAHDYRLMAGSPYIDTGYGVEKDIGGLQFVGSTLVSSPVGLGAEIAGQDGEIRFYWDPVSDAEGYQVYYGLGSLPYVYVGTGALQGDSPIEIVGGADTSIVLTGLTNGVEYYLDVSAYDTTGLESDLTVFTTYATITPADEVAPDYPSGMTATAGDTSITLDWLNPSTFDWAGTAVYRKTSDYPDSAGDGVLVYSGTDTTFKDSGLVNGTPYYYTAFAYDEVPNYTDNACPANCCRATAMPEDVEPPASPVFAAVQGLDKQVTLSWTNPPDPDWTLTRILRRTDTYPTDASDGSAVQVYEGTGTDTTDTGLVNGTTYYYGAFARDEEEVSNWSAAASEAQAEATPQDMTPPVWSDGDGVDSVVTDVGEATLFWDVATDGENPPVFYNVYYDTLWPPWEGTKLSHITPSAGSGSYDLSYTVTGLRNGRRYYLLLRAEDSAPSPNETENVDGVYVWVEYRTPGDTPGTGSRYTLGDLVSISDGGIETGTSYVMFGTVTISAYDTLDISQGTTLYSADRTGEKKLLVLGTLRADGNSTNYITMTGLGSAPGKRWGGLELQNPGLTSRVHGVLVEKSREGIRWYGGNPDIMECLVRETTQAGIAAACDSGAGMNVEVNTVHDCGAGIDCLVLAGGNAMLQDNKAHDNNGTGISLVLEPDAMGTIMMNQTWDNGTGIYIEYLGWGVMNTLDVDENTVYGNTGDGISVGKTSMQTTISHNTVYGNGIGIDFLQESWDMADPNVFTNTVTGNTTAGIRCAGMAHPAIHDCVISNNDGWGILSVQMANPVLTNTTITGNSDGVRCDLYQGVAGTVDLGNIGDPDPTNDGLNRIHGNTLFDVRNLTANPISAQNNWWGLATTAAMQIADMNCPPLGCVPGHGCGQICNIGVIWDVHDQAGLGMVDFSNYMLAPGGGVPPSIIITSPDVGSVGADTSFTIKWTDDDPEQDATISLYYEEGFGVNRHAIPGGTGLSEDDSADSLVWNTTTTDTGTFYIFALITDGWESDSTWSSGTVTIGHPLIDVDTTALTAVLRPDSSTVLTLEIENVGSYDLGFEITDRDSDWVDLSWAYATPPFGSIAPDSILAAGITFDASGCDTGTYSGELVVASSDPWQPIITIDLELTVRAPKLVLSQSTHDFGSVSLGDTLQWDLEVTNTGDDTLSVFSATFSLPDYWLDPPVTGFDLPPAGADTLRVHFAPTEVGSRGDTLWILSDDPDSALMGVPVAGEGMNRLTLSKTLLDFGTIAVFESKSESLWVANGDTASFSVTDVAVGGLPFSVLGPSVPYALAPGDSVVVSLEFYPCTQGSFEDTLTVATDLDGGTQAQVALQGVATYPAISLAATDVDFGVVALGDTATETVLAWNVGTGNLVIADAQTSDSLFWVASPGLPDTIPASDSTLVVIRFTPASPGGVTAILTIASNDPVESTAEVSLSASGPVPDIHLTESSVHFGEAVVGVDTVGGTVLVTNQGLENLEVESLFLSDTSFTVLTNTPFTLVPAETVAISLIFHPLSETFFTEALWIISDDPDPEESTVQVDLFGEGVIPVLGFWPDSLIAQAWEDGSASDSLSVTNDGTGTLVFQVEEADTAPGDLPWLDVSPDSGGVPSGDTLTLSVTFDPASVGDGVYYGKIVFSTNEPGKASSEAALVLRVPRMHYADLDTGNISITVTDEGVFGYTDVDQQGEYGEGIYGSGFHLPPEDPANHLFNGCLWLGLDSTYVADASYDYDWEVVSGGELAITHESGMQVARASWSDANGASPLGLKVHMAAHAAPGPPDDDYVLVEFAIENPAGSPVEGLYAGLYMDWDTGTPDGNVGGYLASKCLGYLRDPDDPDSTCVGLAAIAPVTPASFRLIHNPTYVDPYGEVRDQDAFGFMSGGTIDTTTLEANNWSMMMAAGPMTIASGDSAYFVVVIVAGAGLADLEANSDRARGLYASVDVDSDRRITAYRLGPMRPNPFGREVNFHVAVPEPGGCYSVAVFDVRGRLVKSIFDGQATPGRHGLTWRGQDEAGRIAASGVYVVRLVAGDITRTRKVVLLR